MNLETILTHYLVAVLWTDEHDLGEGFSVCDFTQESKDNAMRDITAFTNEAKDLLENWNDEQIGHDFWLIRVGHGAGFWDRDETEFPNGQAITEICHKYDFHGHTFSQDGKVFIEG